MGKRSRQSLENEVLRILRNKLYIYHHFTLPYCLWSNGTVEVVCRELLRTAEEILSELHFLFKKWTTVLPLVHSALINHKHARLGNKSPVSVFARLPTLTTQGIIEQCNGTDNKYFNPSEVDGYQRYHIAELSTAQEKIHETAAENLQNNASVAFKLITIGL